MSKQTTTAIVFGEALVDAFASGPVAGGAAFNVACHLAALGQPALLITCLGTDAAGDLLRATAMRSGLSLRGAQTQAVSARVEVRESAAGHAFHIPPAQAFDCIDAAAAVQACADLAGPCWLYFGTLALRDVRSREALAALRNRTAQCVFMDLNWRDAGPSPEVILQLLHDVDVLKLSDGELAQLLEWLDLPGVGTVPCLGDHQAVIAQLCARCGIDHVLVTHGAAGAAAWDFRGSCVARALAPSVPHGIDTVGAGDAFSAMLLAGLLCGGTVKGLLEAAVAFASFSCGWRGALPLNLGLYARWRGVLDTVTLAGVHADDASSPPR